MEKSKIVNRMQQDRCDRSDDVTMFEYMLIYFVLFKNKYRLFMEK